MNPATELAMNLADLKLQLRKLTGPYTGRRHQFDAAVQAAIDGINATIVESVDTVHTRKRGGQMGKRQTSRLTDEQRHESWRQRQIRDGSLGNLR